MNDENRLNILAGILDQAARLIRELTEEISQYRAVDREESFLSELDEIVGKVVRHG